MSKKLLFNNVNATSEIESHYYQTYTNYPIEVEDEKLCIEHESYLIEIYGNTEDNKSVGKLQDDGTYKIILTVTNTPMVFGKGGRLSED